MAILSVSGLTKHFRRADKIFTAVDDISFEINEGQILGLLGPNGAGKTTTIDMLLGLIKPSSGQIKMFGLDFEKNRSLILNKMNFSASYLNLVWRLKVIENLYTFARLYDVANFKEKIDRLLDEFGINDIRNKLLTELSSGQLTRVYLCKAFVNEPKLLLLDEPTAFLDPDVADSMRRIITDHVVKNKTSVLFTSHNMAEVTQLCDQVIFLYQGKIIAKDTPSSLAQKIKSCNVNLLFPDKLEKVPLLLNNYRYKFSMIKNEVKIEVEEEKIGQLLGRLSLAKLKYSEISINKPTLEDFFIKVARKKYE